MPSIGGVSDRTQFQSRPCQRQQLHCQLFGLILQPLKQIIKLNVLDFANYLHFSRPSDTQRFNLHAKKKQD